MNDYLRMGLNAYRLVHTLPGEILSGLLGYTQTENEKASNQAQIDYNEYLKAGYLRAYEDWKKNVPNREIKYPEFTYPGNIYRTDTASARAMFDYDTAGANFYGRSLYGTLGLYGVGSRVTRWL